MAFMTQRGIKKKHFSKNSVKLDFCDYVSA